MLISQQEVNLEKYTTKKIDRKKGLSKMPKENPFVKKMKEYFIYDKL